MFTIIHLQMPSIQEVIYRISKFFIHYTIYIQNFNCEMLYIYNNTTNTHLLTLHQYDILFKT